MIALILVLFNLEEEIIIKMNVSNYVIKACLNQKDKDRRLHLVVFYLRKMSLIKRNYNIHNKELLIIVITF
jgi:hypothetical protein